MNIEQSGEQLRAAIQILEKAAASRPLLAVLTSEEHNRLLKAAGDIFQPDPKQRRQFTRARIRHFTRAALSTCGRAKTKFLSLTQ
ncbi:MAG: hypothetical protein WCQ21_34255 [Verrucomicrobiota bacterium]|jgi:hypothetical protein